MNECDYCGKPGCHWSLHPLALQEMREWARTQEPGMDAEYAREHQQ